MDDDDRRVTGPDPHPAEDPLRRVVEVVDRLVSPGGCPWDAEQTHESLVPYLVEEAYEVVDAVAGLRGEPSADGSVPAAASPADGPGAARGAGDAHLAEELGDLLLQVVFHARLAAGRGAFDVDDVARTLAEKLLRRHPHVFGDATVDDAAAVQVSWERLKAAEKPDRGPFDGIPRHLPALARAQKVLGRLERAGLVDAVAPAAVRHDPAEPSAGETAVDGGATLGAALFGLVAAARRRGVDAEQALRDHVRAVEARASPYLVQNRAPADGPGSD